MLMTAGFEHSGVDLRFSPHGTAFLTDAIISAHTERRDSCSASWRSSKSAAATTARTRTFEITERGLVMGDVLAGCHALLTGAPTANGERNEPARSGVRRPPFR